MFTFSDRVVLITGASRGIGRAAAVKFAEAGAAGVIINYQRDGEAAAFVAEAVERAGAKPLIVRADVSRADETSSLVEASLKHFGRLDVAVANAGVWPSQDRAITELDELQWEQTMRINVDGIYHISRAAARIFVAQGGGNIVTVSSTAGQRGEAGHSDYAASKGAVISFTKSLASELGRFNVRVNCVAPGWVDTDMAAPALRDDPALLNKLREIIPIGRIATAEDVAGPILFLASDLARHITGEILNVNGGSVLCG
jgi:3-oxoacyl-[acyl-carrier protein] reductase